MCSKGWSAVLALVLLLSVHSPYSLHTLLSTGKERERGYGRVLLVCSCASAPKKRNLFSSRRKFLHFSDAHRKKEHSLKWPDMTRLFFQSRSRAEGEAPHLAQHFGAYMLLRSTGRHVRLCEENGP